MSLNIIVAITDKNIIGNHGKLPWKISEDLRMFRRFTIGNTVLMGRKTFESIPDKFRPLPGRNNVVISRGDLEIDGVDFCKSIIEGIEKARSFGKDVFIIGGESIYRGCLPYVEKLFVSHVKNSYEGDVYFPDIYWDEWEVENEEDFEEFKFRIYRRKVN